MTIPPGKLISTILKHDAKQTSYKIALLRAVNDVVLSFPDLKEQERDVAIPLTVLADLWIAYYWPFASEERPILQGARMQVGSRLRHDMAFRPELTNLRQTWRDLHGGTDTAADGFFLINELRLPRKRARYPQELLALFDSTRCKVADAIKQPIQYAGPGEWEVFERPLRYEQVAHRATAIPGTRESDVCVLVPVSLWRTFQQVSLWVEALCIHEWCLFSERVIQPDSAVTRGSVYTLLTERPSNRLALTWERNQVNLLLLEGHTFVCPWTANVLSSTRYHLDHLIPVSIYPFNELWNLAPTDPSFNVRKGNRLPTNSRLEQARPHLTSMYGTYSSSADLSKLLKQDATLRFAALADRADIGPEEITHSVTAMIVQIAESRNLARF